ncbi:WXG100 family type VII secretion target [Streptomyces sp. NPDC086080]|uniref:WXG100 family type VII secretion target n=1 Tax=Streptomyces sp. NPDC086080 TaxID=3365748 RepID=UPI0037D60026
MSENYTDGIIHVSYRHMDNAADDLVEQTKAMGKTLQSLELELNALQQTWIGDDADVYHEKKRLWDAAYARMAKLLTDNAFLLTDISGHYRYTAGNLAQRWSDVRIGR